MISNFDPLLATALTRRPLLLALAGANGAGKSTFFQTHLSGLGLPFVNADKIAKDRSIGAYEAAAVAESNRRSLMENKESFIFETVFSDPAGDKLNFLKEAEAAGYTVVLCFIGTSSARTSEERVAMRVSQGGHDVPTEKLLERYPRVMKNLGAALRSVPFIWIFDNSNLEEPYRLIARVVSGRATALRDPLPNWLKSIWPA